MTGRRIRVAVLFGGRSAEHEVSIRSAKSILDALDPERFRAIPIGIDRDGGWHFNDDALPLLEDGEPVALLPEHTAEGTEHRLVSLDGAKPLGTIDVVFPVLHGTFGEDGTVQGMLELAAVPYVGSGVLGSAVGMDKDVAKRLLRDAGIPVAPFRVFRTPEKAKEAYSLLRSELGGVLFVKPASLGSSVGVNRTENEGEFIRAVDDAFLYDTKIMVERAITGREIECSVLGNDDPQASIPGEIRPAGEFYSYEAKYVDEDGAELIIPAPLPDGVTGAVQALACRAFRTLCLSGMARVDMFLEDEAGLMVNEVNTIPGFTDISMYPKLWEAAGLPYPDLVARLIELAVERHAEQSKRSTRYAGDTHSPAERR